MECMENAPYAARVVKHVRIPMSDGVELAANLYMPAAEGAFPAVFDLYPYRKDDTFAEDSRCHYYFAQHGFVGVRLEVRGTGSSGGTAEDEYTPQEQQDAIEAIAWMARQPWCNGNVGMFGYSYGGFNSLQVAMHRPPALKAICPMYFTDNRYTDDCHYKGGALQMLYDVATYGTFMVAINAMPPYPNAVGLDWAHVWEEHLRSEPWLLRWLENQTLSDYWRQGSLCEDYASIQCATFLIGGWRDGYTNCNLRTFEHLRCPKKLLIGPWLHCPPDLAIPGPQVNYLHEMVRFFAHWLKGEPNDVMDEPAVTLYVQRYDPPAATRSMTSGFWRHEASWPLERAQARQLYLHPGHRLAAEPPKAPAAELYAYNPTVGSTFGMFSAAAPLLLPVDQRLEDALSLSWTSAPLREPLEILGHSEISLRLAVSTDIATLCVRLIDVAPDGTTALVTKGVLNLTHRDSHEQPTALIPDRPYSVRITLDATSWLFEPGHCLRLSLAGADFPNAWPSPKPYVATFFLGGEDTPALTLPALSAQEPALPAPRLHPPANVAPTADVQGDPPVWRISRDLIAGTAEVTMRTSDRTRVGDEVSFSRSQEVVATVHEHDPARASVRGLTHIVQRWMGRSVDTRALGQIESTEDAFCVTIQLDVQMDNLPYLQKHWTRTIPRHLV